MDKSGNIWFVTFFFNEIFVECEPFQPFMILEFYFNFLSEDFNDANRNNMTENAKGSVEVS